MKDAIGLFLLVGSVFGVLFVLINLEPVSDLEPKGDDDDDW